MRKALIIAAMAAVALAACDRQPADNQSVETAEAPSKGVERSHSGEAMPDAPIFNPDDEEMTLAEASGTPLLVNLWASWCAPCVKELPTLEALSRRPGAPRVIIVSEDIGERPSVDAFLESHGIADLESWRDPKMALSGALGVQVMPATIYYDASGREIWRYVGDLDWTSEEAARLLSETRPAATR